MNHLCKYTVNKMQMTTVRMETGITRSGIYFDLLKYFLFYAWGVSQMVVLQGSFANTVIFLVGSRQILTPIIRVASYSKRYWMGVAQYVYSIYIAVLLHTWEQIFENLWIRESHPDSQVNPVRYIMLMKHAVVCNKLQDSWHLFTKE